MAARLRTDPAVWAMRISESMMHESISRAGSCAVFNYALEVRRIQVIRIMYFHLSVVSSYNFISSAIIQERLSLSTSHDDIRDFPHKGAYLSTPVANYDFAPIAGTIQQQFDAILTQDISAIRKGGPGAGIAQ